MVSPVLCRLWRIFSGNTATGGFLLHEVSVLSNSRRIETGAAIRLLVQVVDGD
jgi:hypothetical protein